MAVVGRKEGNKDENKNTVEDEPVSPMLYRLGIDSIVKLYM
jgi:hypothetical protein